MQHTLSVAGQSFLLSAYGSTFGSMFVILDDFSNREEPGLYCDEIANTLRKRFLKEVPDAVVTVFPAAPVRGVGRTGGFKFMLEDRGDAGLKTLQEQTDNLVEKGNQMRSPEQRPLLVGLFSVFRANAPQLFVDMNRKRCMTMGVPLADAFNALQVYLGSLYVNDFNLFGRTWEVIVQADGQFRNRLEQVKQFKVRNKSNTMVPLGAIADVQSVNGPLVITRYNMYPAAAINGNTGPGVSSGQGIGLMQQLADKELLSSMHYEWTEMAYFELQAGNTAMTIFGFAVIMVFLVLAAQYESWSLALGRHLGRAHVPAQRRRRRIGGAGNHANAGRHVRGRCRGSWAASAPPTSTFSRKSASWSWLAWPAKMPFSSSSLPNTAARTGPPAARPPWTPASSACGRSS